MKVGFDLSFDGPTYPGPLGSSDVSYGEAWVGPAGLLGLLETGLGLGSAFCDTLERATKLAACLKHDTGFWRASFEVDPVATCERLLRDRDLLAMWGWNGEHVSQKLDEVAKAGADAPAGIPDRLRAIISVLQSRRPALDSITSFTRAEHLPPLWAEVFRLLEKRGVSVTWQQLNGVDSKGDLAALRNGAFIPSGDGSLVLLRRHGPLDTADEVAATLAAMPDLRGVVVIGADSVLDEALFRHGLPVSGDSSSATASSRLLNFVVETAFCPIEPAFLHALLTAEYSPIPRGLRTSLVYQLQRMPGRGTKEFNEALDKALEAAANKNDDKLAVRVKHFLLPVVEENDMSVSARAIDERITALQTWARSRVDRNPSLHALLGATSRFRGAVAALGETRLSQQTLRRICTDVGSESWNFTEGQAGLLHVRTPGAITAPAKTVVWWNFSRATAPRPQRLFLTVAERDAIDRLGIKAPDARLVNAHAEAWRRPLHQTQSQLLLVCPEHDLAGEKSELHPLWDEIIATLKEQDSVARLIMHELRVPFAAPRRAVEAKPLVYAAVQLKTTHSLKLREKESPSSLELLLGCSLNWALHYKGQVDSRLASPLPKPTPLLYGSVAHDILEKILLRPDRTEAEAADFAAVAFDQQAKDQFESLHLPQYQAQKAALRLAVVESARALVRIMRKHKAVVAGTEVVGRITVDGMVVEGRSDLVWKSPGVVLDLKWGRSTPAEKLRTGTHLQLAAYAAMHATDGKWPESAYFALYSQELLTEPNGILQDDGITPGRHTAEAVWNATLAAVARRRIELDAGDVRAPGADASDPAATLVGATLSMAAPCRYCNYAALCGRGAAR